MKLNFNTLKQNILVYDNLTGIINGCFYDISEMNNIIYIKNNNIELILNNKNDRFEVHLQESISQEIIEEFFKKTFEFAQPLEKLNGEIYYGTWIGNYTDNRFIKNKAQKAYKKSVCELNDQLCDIIMDSNIIELKNQKDDRYYLFPEPEFCGILCEKDTKYGMFMNLDNIYYI